MVSEEINFLVFETYALMRVTVHGKNVKKKPKLKKININGHYMLDDPSYHIFDLI